MRIAVLSGKGGTGKTLVSVNLACAAQEAVYIDCDVEEPNGYLFFKPEQVNEEPVSIKIPLLDESRCTGCRKCVDFCRFNALAFLTGKPYVFEEVCHSCGGCVLICPEKAFSEKEKKIGKIERGQSGKVSVNTGILNTGEASGVPIIKKLLHRENSKNAGWTFIDCPPGSACIVMESIKDADYCILVAEPTLFGVHNLGMVYKLVKLFQKPFGVILNKCLPGVNPAETFCEENGMRILWKIDYDTELGILNSNAQVAVRQKAAYDKMFTSILEIVEREAMHETAADSKR